MVKIYNLSLVPTASVLTAEERSCGGDVGLWILEEPEMSINQMLVDGVRLPVKMIL